MVQLLGGEQWQFQRSMKLWKKIILYGKGEILCLVEPLL